MKMENDLILAGVVACLTYTIDLFCLAAVILLLCFSLLSYFCLFHSGCEHEAKGIEL